MKTFALVLFISMGLSQSLSRAASSTIQSRKPSTSEAPAVMNTTSANEMTLHSNPEKVISASLMTNIAELSKGNGNIQAEFFVNPHLAPSIQFLTSSAKEERPKLSNQKLTVDRSEYGLGVSLYWKEANAPTNLVFSPAVYFSQEKDAIDVDNKTGIGALIAAQIIPQKVPMKFVGGLKLNNVSGDFKGTAYVGAGVLF